MLAHAYLPAPGKQRILSSRTVYAIQRDTLNSSYLGSREKKIPIESIVNNLVKTLSSNLKQERQAGETAQYLAAHTALAEDQSSVPSTHTRQLTYVTLALGGSHAYDLLWHQHSQTHPTHKHIYT